MRGDKDCILILSTCPATDVAGDIARALLDGKFAACVNIIPGITSHFRWQGNIDQAGELLLLIKTTRGHYREVEMTIRSMHPYELPEIIAVPIELGLTDYLAWINEET